ncbi:hypothetical protein [Sphingomonas sp.]|uniref:hypothetical protein n=1 Tax=Sphingomonas sp. TaxID=28214 RepID=UPI003CC582F5
MRRWRAVAAMGLVGTAAPPAERIVTGDRLVAITVGGLPLRFRIDPGVPGLPLVAAPVAERLSLRGGGLLALGVAFSIGHERFYGRTQVVRLGWNGTTAGKRRVGWLFRAYPLAVDGTIGPAGVPEQVVRFAFHAPRAGERTVTLPMAGGGGLFGDWFALGAAITVGGKPLMIRFDPDHALTLVTAPAGVRLAAANGGTLTAQTARQEIAYGVERPLRVMRLARPLAVGPLSLTSLAVRITDGGGANTIPEAGADPAEVMVTARGRQQPGVMTVGADQLDRCSSLVFDKGARQVRLSCS